MEIVKLGVNRQLLLAIQNSEKLRVVETGDFTARFSRSSRKFQSDFQLNKIQSVLHVKSTTPRIHQRQSDEKRSDKPKTRFAFSSLLCSSLEALTGFPSPHSIFRYSIQP